MAPSRPTAMEAWPTACLAARAGLFAFWLLTAVLAPAVRADEPAPAALLKTLDLRGYTSRGSRQWESAPARALIEALLAEPAPGAATQ